MKINKFNMKRGGQFFAILLVLSFIAIVIAIFFDRGPKLQVTINHSGEVLFEQPIKPGDTFYHEYIHSVMKSPIREVFLINENFGMTAKQTWTKSFGAGIPYLEMEEDDFEKVDGFYIIPGGERIVDRINLMPSNLYDHTFRYEKEEVIFLSDLKEEDRKLTIEVTGG